MKKIVITLIITLLMFGFGLCSFDLNAQSSSEEDWIELFNGENLDGWDVKITGYELNDNYANTFRVVDGVLTNRYDGYDEFGTRFGHLYHNQSFSHYRLVAEYRFVDKQVDGGPGWAFMNNGIMFHSQPAHTVELNQEFPNSIEYQLLGVDDDSERSNGNVCTPGTHIVIDGELRTVHCISSNGPTHRKGEWITAELVVYGDSLARHILNGEEVMEYGGLQLDDGTPLTSGHIAIQSESHPTEFRSIRVLNLEGCMDEEALNYKSHYVKADPYSCQY